MLIPVFMGSLSGFLISFFLLLPFTGGTMIREQILLKISDKKLSVRQVALKCDVTYQNFHAFLRGKRGLPLDDLERVCEYLKLKLR